MLTGGKKWAQLNEKQQQQQQQQKNDDGDDIDRICMCSNISLPIIHPPEQSFLYFEL